MSESPRRRVRPAPVLPPPQVPDAWYGHPYPYRAQQPGTSDQWYPRDNADEPGQYIWPPPQVAYGGWGPPAPRRTNIVGRLLLGVVGTGAALFFALIVLSALATTSTSVRGDIASHEPVPASRPQASPVDRQNAVAVLSRNTLYSQGGLRNGSCPAQDLGAASSAEQTRFYQSLMNCLNQEWRPPIQRAGYFYEDPGLVVFDSPVSTPCGNAAPKAGRTLAFYCPSDSVMYADVPQMKRFFGDVDVAYAIVIGHEFGHHVQSEADMIAAYNRAAYGNFADRTDLSRRLELQASCMGGLFLGAIADSFPIDERRFTQLQQVAGSFGDEPSAAENERDHGSGESNRSWILQGFGNNDLAACNTFVAAPTDVD